MTDIFTKEKRSKIMSRVKNKGTDIEMSLRKGLFKQGLRFRINSKIIGKPDIVFPRKKIAIFCDGDFWHGRNYLKESGKYKKFWKEKIKVNMLRDRKIDSLLKEQGWRIMRFWETDIIKSVDKCVSKIKKTITKIK